MRILGTGFQRAGKASRILVGGGAFNAGTALTFASWSATMTTEDYPTVNFESFNASDLESYDEGLHGPISCEASWGGDWDAGTNPTGPQGFPSVGASVPSLFPRDDMNGVTFMNNRIDVIGWFFTYMRIRSCVNSTDAKGKVTFSVGSSKNQGRFTFPIANAVGGQP